MSDNETGWVKDNGSYYYYYSDGTMATGWQQLDGDWYYFYDDGSMTWSNEVDGYYLGSDGRMVTDERWVNTEEDNSGTWYYVGSDEKVVTGWNKIGDDFHYFNHPGGSMTWDNTIDGFYLDNDGKMVSGTGWLKDEYSGDWYYFSDGQMTTGWVQDGDNWYYLNDDGKMATGWENINGDWYYFYSDGEMATGWVNDGNGWYYLYGNGSMAWGKTVDGYLLDNGGKMVTGTGWESENGDWYYLKDDKEVTGWLEDGDNWYYLYGDNGSMAWGTTIDGYYLNNDGEWVPNEEDIGGNLSNEVTDGAAVTYDGTDIPEDDGIIKRLANGTIVRLFKNINEFFKYEFLMGVGDTNGEEGVVYVTDEQEKLADAGADMLTTELGGDFVAIVANGVRAYKNIKTGEIIYNESYVAGSGAGNIAKGESKVFDAETATTKQKGNFGEIQSNDNILNNQSIKDAGYDLESVGRDAPTGIDDKIVKGIDGLYRNKNADSNIKYVIDEAKFGSSKLGTTKDGLQMSDDWLKGTTTGKSRILKAVDGDKKLANDITNALKQGKVERVLSKIDSDGNVTTYRLDSDGNVTGVWP